MSRQVMLALLGLAAVVAGETTATTFTTASGIRYYVPHIEIAQVSGLTGAALSAPLTPFAVVDATGENTLTMDLSRRLAEYQEQDDVYSDLFSDLIYVQSQNTTLQGTGNGTVLLSSSQYPASAKLMPGPYFFNSNGSVYKVYRLYDDRQSAFTTGLVQASRDSFEEVSASSFTGQAEAAVPVPSRLYFRRTPCKPLSGMRVAVKDIYHVKGVKTGAASRAYYELYPPRNESAPSIQRLIAAGAVIVAKSKTSQFANGENPTADWIEVLAPFNPRGDGWQYPSSSSSGSGAAMASYDWLDYAIGTDTSGSMRFPAAYNGVFGARQSHGGMTTDGLVPVSTSLDTLGVFARSAADHEAFVRTWYGDSTYTSYPNFPRKIYRITNATVGGFPVTVDAAQAVYDAFVDKLAHFLAANVTDLDPTAAWRAQSPVPEQELLVYTNMSYLAIAWYEQVQLLQVPFFADWAAYKNSTATPPLGPKARASFAYGNNNVTAASYREALAIKANFTSWWSTVINPADADGKTCSEAIYVYPTGARGAPTYRDTYLSTPNVVVNWQVSHAAVYGGLPDYAVPVGQVEYLSRLTGMNETLPVSISIGAGRGCDWMLSKLMTALEAVGVTSPVQTGEIAFP